MKRRSFFFAMAALAALALSAPATHADSIVVSSDSGSLGSFTLTNLGGGQLSLDLTGTGSLELVNGTSVGTIPASFTNPITFTATPSGGGTFAISGTPPLSKTFGTGGAAATLDFTVTAGVTPLSAFLNLTGLVTAVSNPTGLSGFDFSGFNSGGSNTLTLTGLNFNGASDFAGVLTTTGASVSGNGSFAESAVPEPTSMALLGIGLTGLFTFRRFLKRAFVA